MTPSQGRHRLVQWRIMYLPKKFGEVDIRDLITQNISLLLCWLWLFDYVPDSLWSERICPHFQITSWHDLSNVMNLQNSFLTDLPHAGVSSLPP
jgi:hypothetical protein